MEKDEVKEFFLNLFSNLLVIYDVETAIDRLKSIKDFMMNLDKESNIV